MDEINRVAEQTVYNGATVLDGSRDSNASGSAQSIQVGTDAGQSISFDVRSIKTGDLGLTGFDDGNGGTASVSVLSASGASDALAKISSAIEQVAGGRAELGAVANRLEYTVSNLMNVAEYTTAARSRIEDADFAAESARLAKAQVLQQTGTAMLAQANASQQLALSLFR